MLKLIYDDVTDILPNIDFSKLKNKRILITGASGLVGIYMMSCIERFREKNDLSIWCWINNNLEPKFEKLFENCVVIHGDITDKKNFIALPNFDIIIHAAGYGQPGKFLEDKIKTIKLNTDSTTELFKLLNKDGKFLFISTSEIYNGLNLSAITEEQIGTTNTDHFRSSYIEGKRCGEALCYAHKDIGYDVKIARLSLAYGPGTRKNDKRVLNAIIQRGIQEKDIRLMDGGSAVRTYCYISDVVEMMWNILLHGKKTVYNVGGQSQTTILDLAEMVGKKLSKKVIVPTDDLNSLSGNPTIVNISIERYLSEFNKKSFIDLNDGLESTIEWQREIYK